jgi:hypothetical protein
LGFEDLIGPIEKSTLVTAASWPKSRLFRLARRISAVPGAKYLGNDLSGNTFIRSPHAHNSDKVHFELKVSHGTSNMESRALFPAFVCAAVYRNEV